MGFLDNAKEKATQFTELAKKKVDDLKGKRKSGALIADLGRTVFRQRTGRGEAGDDAAIASIVAELQALEADGAAVLTAKDPVAPTNGSGFAPPPKSAPAPSTPTSTASGDNTSLPTAD